MGGGSPPPKFLRVSEDPSWSFLKSVCKPTHTSPRNGLKIDRPRPAFGGPSIPPDLQSRPNRDSITLIGGSFRSAGQALAVPGIAPIPPVRHPAPIEHVHCRSGRNACPQVPEVRCARIPGQDTDGRLWSFFVRAKGARLRRKPKSTMTCFSAPIA